MEPGGSESDAIHVDWGWGETWIPAADGYDERGTEGSGYADATQRTLSRGTSKTPSNHWITMKG